MREPLQSSLNRSVSVCAVCVPATGCKLLKIVEQYIVPLLKSFNPTNPLLERHPNINMNGLNLSIPVAAFSTAFCPQW
jgi:hypothetical protein